jgi:hypothetical protein
MLRLKASPTFKAKVGIPVAGGPSIEVELEFRHMTRDALNEFLSGPGASDRSYEDTISQIVVGWSGVDAPYSKEAVCDLCQNYLGAPTAILAAYGKELAAARLGN